MRAFRPIGAALAAVGLGVVLTPLAGGAAGPGLSLGVQPTRLVLLGRADGSFQVRNPTGRELVVDTSTADFLLTAKGTAVVSPKLPSSRSARRWLTVSPATLRIAAHTTVTVLVSSHPAGNASPGDHHALVLFTTKPSGAGVVRTRTQIGLPVLVRVSGKIVRKLKIASLTAKKGRSATMLRLVIRNEGNINERLLRRSLTVRLERGGRALATLAAPARSVLPDGRAVYTLRTPKGLSGGATAEVKLRPAAPQVEGAFAPPSAPITRRFRVSL